MRSYRGEGTTPDLNRGGATEGHSSHQPVSNNLISQQAFIKRPGVIRSEITLVVVRVEGGRIKLHKTVKTVDD